MIPASCDYYRASSAQEAIDLLARHDGAKLLAGGHSLIPMMKLRLAAPPALIDIGRIAEIRGICEADGELRIGSLTPHAEIAASDLVRAKCAVLAEAAAKIGDPQVRNKGTIGGNIAHADPASDLPAVLMALDASIHLLGAGGARRVAAREFFHGLLTTELGDGEIITEIGVPDLGDAGSCYLKVEHPASGYAVCGAAAVVRLAGGSVESASLGFNGVAATPVLATAVTDALGGSAADDAAIDAAVDGNLAIDDPLGDIHASGAYRVALAKAYGKQALKQARDRAGG